MPNKRAPARIPRKYPFKCATKFCRRLVHKTGKSPFCARCRSRRFKEKFPLKYSFNKLKQRARERGHAFNLTYDQYEKFAVESGYALDKGKQPTSLSIDRIEGSKGYEVGNIRVLTLSENTRKEFVNYPGKDGPPKEPEVTRADCLPETDYVLPETANQPF